jgi:hypothetical protein
VCYPVSNGSFLKNKVLGCDSELTVYPHWKQMASVLPVSSSDTGRIVTLADVAARTHSNSSITISSKHPVRPNAYRRTARVRGRSALIDAVFSPLRIGGRLPKPAESEGGEHRPCRCSPTNLGRSRNTRGIEPEARPRPLSEPQIEVFRSTLLGHDRNKPEAPSDLAKLRVAGGSGAPEVARRLLSPGSGLRRDIYGCCC